MRNCKFKDILTREVLQDLYSTQEISMPMIGKTFGCSARTVGDYLKRYNIPIFPTGHFRQSIYSKNDAFFTIPNILNSFVAGFIAADGCLRERIFTRKSHELIISLSIKDLDYLVQIKNLLEYTGAGPQISNNKCHLRINSATQYYHDLYNHFNITPNKSLTMSPSRNLSWNNKLAFIVGLIDGDGCIFRNKRNCLIVEITGSYETCIWVKEVWDQILREHDFIKMTRLYKYKKRHAYSISLCSKRAECVLNILNNIDVPKMERKWSKV